MVIIGGVKGMRAVIQEVLVNPILSDQFGFSDQNTTYFFLVFFLGPPTGTILLWACNIWSVQLLESKYVSVGSFLLQSLKVKSYGLTLLGMLTTMTSLLLMTDWQAIGHDPCMDYSLLHHPHLIDEYKLELAHANVSEMQSRHQDAPCTALKCDMFCGQLAKHKALFPTSKPSTRIITAQEPSWDFRMHG